MKKNKIMIYLVTLIFGTVVYAPAEEYGNVKIYGSVVSINAGSKKPLKRVKITLTGNPSANPHKTVTKTTRTGNNGVFRFKRTLEGRYTIKAEKKGYIILEKYYNFTHSKQMIFKGYKIKNSNYLITTVAGNGEEGYSGDGGLATDASLSELLFVDVDVDGNLYIADSFNNVIRKVDKAGIITTIAGTGEAGCSGDGGLAVNAELGPSDIILDSESNIYVADTNRIRKINAEGIITTTVGDGYEDEDGEGRFQGDDGLATEASLNVPRGVEVDGEGNLYIADTRNLRIRKVDTDGIITTIAGDGFVNDAAGFGIPRGDGGLAVDASFFYPEDIGLKDGNIYVADYGIRKINSEGIISTIYYGRKSYYGESVSAKKKGGPVGRIVINENKIILTTFINLVRVINKNNKVFSIAGNGSSGFSGDGGPATEARLNNVTDVAVDSEGNIYIADSGNYRIRKLTPITAQSSVK